MPAFPFAMKRYSQARYQTQLTARSGWSMSPMMVGSEILQALINISLSCVCAPLSWGSRQRAQLTPAFLRSLIRSAGKPSHRN